MLENKFFPYIESFITIFQYTTTKNIFTKTSLHSKKLSKSTKKTSLAKKTWSRLD